MKKYNKLIIIFFLTAFYYPGIAQSTNAENVIQSYNDYQENNYQEKVYVHTDKSFYLAGETIWFKVYDVDEYFNEPAKISSICYVEIIDSAHHAVLQTKISLQNGSGYGSLIIPATVPSANYLFRAYTNWMKNFDPDFYFKKNITVINTLANTHVNKINQTDSSAYNVQFFPEGGNLVNGVECKVGFKITDQNGKGIDAEGDLIDDNNNTVADFKTMKFGMGNFVFTPQTNLSYRAVIKVGDKKIIQDLPKAFENGYAVRLTDVDSATLKLSVFSNTPSPGLVYLFIQSHNLLSSVQQENIKNKSADFYFKKNDLKDGITQLTVFNEQKQPVCERLYFKRPEKILQINAQTDKIQYVQKQKAELHINTFGITGEKKDADLSVAVYQVDTLQKTGTLNILNYLMLASDIKGIIEAPDFYLENSEEAEKAADNLMLTQGWRRFKWEDILQNKKPLFSFLPETEGFLIKGEITYTISPDKKNIASYLSIPGKPFFFTSAVSDENGNAIFNIKRFNGKKNMVIQNDDRNDSLYRMTFENPYSEKFSDIFLNPLFISSQLTSLFTEKNIDLQVNNSTDLKAKFKYESVIDSLNFYIKPDQQYYLDNYTRFTTMDEVLHEYVTDLHVRKHNDDYVFNVGDDNYKTFFDDKPLVLFDGVPVFNNNKIMEMDPLKIERLDVVSRKFYAGSLVNNGILSFSTYKGDLAGYKLDPKSIVVEFEGVQNEREFYSPVYNINNNNDHIPDFRNVLLWKPDVKTTMTKGADLSFFTSNLTGNFSVMIEGISNDGTSGYNILNFSVAK